MAVFTCMHRVVLASFSLLCISFLFFCTPRGVSLIPLDLFLPRQMGLFFLSSSYSSSSSLALWAFVFQSSFWRVLVEASCRIWLCETVVGTWLGHYLPVWHVRCSWFLVCDFIGFLGMFYNPLDSTDENSQSLTNRLFSHNVVTMETSAIGWPPGLITFWYLWIFEQLYMHMHLELTWFLQTQRIKM